MNLQITSFIKIIRHFAVLLSTVFGITYSSWASSTFTEIDTVDEAKSVYPLFSQLNTWITEAEYLDNFVKAKQGEYHLCKVTDHINDTDVTVGLIGYMFSYELYVGRTMYVDTIVVDSAVRRSGYGKQIMQYAIQTFQIDHLNNNCKLIKGQTGHRRHDAINFYNSFGYSEFIDGHSFCVPYAALARADIIKQFALQAASASPGQ